MTMAQTASPLTPLARVLAAFGVSQQELAARSGLARQTVRDAYHGRTVVSLDTWVTIAKTLHVPLRRVSPDAADALDGLVID